MKILVILGNELNKDDSLSQAGKLRVFAGIKIHQSEKFDRIIFSCGYTHSHKISEAAAMVEEAKVMGASESIMILEERSKNTIENGKYTVEILKDILKAARGELEVFVLSSKSHIARRFHNPVEIFDGYAKGVAGLNLIYIGV